MPYLGADAPWLTFGEIAGFRFLPYAARYDPDAPYASPRGRFNNGTRLTLYVAETAEGATAEFYRSRPEFLGAQGTIALIRLFEVRLEVVGRCLDVRGPDAANLVDIDYERLRSSEDDEHERYAACRELAELVDDEGTGIAYPSAALRDQSWNLVVFGPPSPASWASRGFVEHAVPQIDPAAVTVVG